MSIYQTIATLAEQNRMFVVATVLEVIGSTPGKNNFKAVIDQNGLIAGTIGGGKIELVVIAEAQAVLVRRKNLVKSYNLTSGPENLGMQCGGSTTIIFEYIGTRDRVVVFGGGHISQSLTPLLKSIDFHIALVENRAEFCTKELHPAVDEFFLSEFEEIVPHIPIDESTCVVIVSPTHRYDMEILRALFRTSVHPRFLGVIASKRKALTIRKELEELFPGDPRIKDLKAPLGLDIGGETHQQIALSIAAQLQAVKFGKV